ncbi:hypothetical protein IGI04_033748 [Brassica rapa subsp. trilocularis]|uniref:LOB domain-containing protein n=1 Tax=Brassica rapa subsp. trilocularis TaxID=1813537 RepID=A0ABQ7L6S0_BRACM|nr:hypothetical protein IGI04_033748 [Brassica rapa subsp. trilocularis]
MASSNSPCSACKFLRRRCTRECVFAPHFSADQPNKFSCVHKAFGASNVAKLLSELTFNQREDAVTSLVYEAETRIQDPVYGCVGLISLQQQRLKQIQRDTDVARRELATYIGPQAMLPILQPQQTHLMPQTPPLQQFVPETKQAYFMPETQQQTQQPQPETQQTQFMQQTQETQFMPQTDQTQSMPQTQQMQFMPQTQKFMPQTQRPSSSSVSAELTQQQHHDLFPSMAIPTAQLYQQQFFEFQQLEAVAREKHSEMLRAYGEEGSSSSHQHHQNQPEAQVLRFNDGFDSVPTGSVTSTGFNQLTPSGTTVTSVSHSLALGGTYDIETQLTMPTQSSQQLPLQTHDAQLFMSTQASKPQQQHCEAQLSMPSQSSQPLPLQTKETQTSSESDEGS